MKFTRAHFPLLRLIPRPDPRLRRLPSLLFRIASSACVESFRGWRTKAGRPLTPFLRPLCRPPPSPEEQTAYFIRPRCFSLMDALNNISITFTLRRGRRPRYHRVHDVFPRAFEHGRAITRIPYCRILARRESRAGDASAMRGAWKRYGNEAALELTDCNHGNVNDRPSLWSCA